ncbi:hypothetical protein [Ralstonia insidiosa]|uniref:Uncharacterized protein n=1 Tax=Ralstonia insidiosa TaxID=190721 RepID=A0A848P3N5_9RALS|nr:hypothetical protein [Ralstonia insidiosa]NMV40270.1 hypothetical protein [Ralstonia insidiosa]
MSAIIAVSEIEKKAEQHSSSATAPICAQSGQESKVGAEEKQGAHYSRGVCRANAGGCASRCRKWTSRNKKAQQLLGLMSLIDKGISGRGERIRTSGLYVPNA